MSKKTLIFRIITVRTSDLPDAFLLFYRMKLLSY